MRKICIVDYGSGNLRSVEKAVRRIAPACDGAFEILVTCDSQTVAASDAVILPGVGAFAACSTALGEREGLKQALETAVIRRGVPFLGICVGMQLMADRGLEFGETAGFGWISGDVIRLAPAHGRHKVPHMGWNALEMKTPHPLLAGLPSGTEMYFTHSYQLAAASADDLLATSEHGEQIVAAVGRNNFAGVQFHPEKSQAAGLRLLKNFLEWRP